MSYMLSDCKSLKEIDLSPFKNNKLENINNLFKDCTSLTSINLKDFNTE